MRTGILIIMVVFLSGIAQAQEGAVSEESSPSGDRPAPAQTGNMQWTVLDSPGEDGRSTVVRERATLGEAEAGAEASAVAAQEAMDAEIPMWGGTRQRKEGLFAYIGEVYHHKGQVAYIRGTYKRLNE